MVFLRGRKGGCPLSPPAGPRSLHQNPFPGSRADQRASPDHRQIAREAATASMRELGRRLATHAPSNIIARHIAHGQRTSRRNGRRMTIHGPSPCLAGGSGNYANFRKPKGSRVCINEATGNIQCYLNPTIKLSTALQLQLRHPVAVGGGGCVRGPFRGPQCS